MLGPAVLIVLQAAVFVGGVQSYEQAYEDTQSTGRPLVVLVGAEWCPGCRTMKHAVLPRMQGSGRLSGVNYVQVDSDRQGDLASLLMRGGTIPQLIVYSQSGDGRWHREQLTGAAGEAAVAAVVGRAVSRVADRPAQTRISSSGGAIGN